MTAKINWESLQRVADELGPNGGQAWAVVHPVKANVGDEIAVIPVTLGPRQAAPEPLRFTVGG